MTNFLSPSARLPKLISPGAKRSKIFAKILHTQHRCSSLTTAAATGPVDQLLVTTPPSTCLTTRRINKCVCTYVLLRNKASNRRRHTTTLVKDHLQGWHATEGRIDQVRLLIQTFLSEPFYRDQLPVVLPGQTGYYYYLLQHQHYC